MLPVPTQTPVQLPVQSVLPASSALTERTLASKNVVQGRTLLVAKQFVHRVLKAMLALTIILTIRSSVYLVTTRLENRLLVRLVKSDSKFLQSS